MAIINGTSKMVTNDNSGNGGGSGTMSGKFAEVGPAPGHCKNLVGTIKNNNTSYTSIDFTWEDPILEGVPYGGTKLVVKEGSMPSSSEDGIVAVDYNLKDNYKLTPFKYYLPKGKIGERTFYASLYPYSSSGAINEIGAVNSSFTVTMTEPTYEFNKKSDKRINYKLINPSTTTIWNDKLYSLKYLNLTSISLSKFDSDDIIVEIDDEYSISSDDFIYSASIQKDSLIKYNNKLIFFMTTEDVKTVEYRYKIAAFEFDGTAISKFGESVAFKENRTVIPIIVSGNLYLFGNIATDSTEYTCAKIENGIITPITTELPENYVVYNDAYHDENNYSELWISGAPTGWGSIKKLSFNYENDKMIITQFNTTQTLAAKDGSICKFDKWILYIKESDHYIHGYNVESGLVKKLSTNTNKVEYTNDSIIALKDNKILTVKQGVGSDNLYYMKVFKYEEITDL